jgi:hypothetical protein
MWCVAVYLGMVEEPEDEVVVDVYSSDSDSSEDDSSIGEVDYVKEAEALRKKEEEEKREKDALEAGMMEDSSSDRAFDMKKNLQKIGCDRFYEELVAEGFVDEVCCVVWYGVVLCSVM